MASAAIPCVDGLWKCCGYARHRWTRASLVGVGGISTPEAAWERITAGASLVQLYTGWIYEGPDLVPRVWMDCCCSWTAMDSATSVRLWGAAPLGASRYPSGRSLMTPVGGRMLAGLSDRFPALEGWMRQVQALLDPVRSRAGSI